MELKEIYKPFKNKNVDLSLRFEGNRFLKFHYAFVIDVNDEIILIKDSKIGTLKTFLLKEITSISEVPEPETKYQSGESRQNIKPNSVSSPFFNSGGRK